MDKLRIVNETGKVDDTRVLVGDLDITEALSVERVTIMIAAGNPSVDITLRVGLSRLDVQALMPNVTVIS